MTGTDAYSLELISSKILPLLLGYLTTVSPCFANMSLLQSDLTVYEFLFYYNVSINYEFVFDCFFAYFLTGAGGRFRLSTIDLVSSAAYLSRTLSLLYCVRH